MGQGKWRSFPFKILIREHWESQHRAEGMFCSRGPDETLREDCTRPGVKGCPSVGQRGRRDAQDGPGAPREVLHHLGPRFPHWPEGKIVSPAKLLCI